MKKRIFSFILAAVMVLSLGTVAFGTDTTTVTDPAAGSTGTKLEIDGEIINIDTEIYSVVLPTKEAFMFKLDPLGLIGIEIGETADLKDLEGGKIVSVPPVAFINNSSVPIKLDVLAQATTTPASGTSNAALTFVDDKDLVEAGSTNYNVLLYLVPSAVDLGPVDSEFTMSETGYVVGKETASAAALSFALPEAEYEITNEGNGTYTIDAQADTGHGSALKVGGFVNSKAKWSQFAVDGVATSGKVGLDVTFTFVRDDDVEDRDPDTAFDASEAEFLLDTQDTENGGTAALTTITIVPDGDDDDDDDDDGSGSGVTETPYSVTNPANGTLTFKKSVSNPAYSITFDWGTLAAPTGISTVYLEQTSGGNKTGTLSTYTFSAVDKKLTINTTGGLYNTGWTVGDYDVTITFDNNKTVELTLKLQN